MEINYTEVEIENTRLNFLNNELINEFESKDSYQLIILKEVGDIIKLTSIQSIKNWLSQSKIKIHKFSKANLVFQFEVDVIIDKMFVRELKMKHPENWEQLYKKISKNEQVFEMVVYDLGGEVLSTPRTKVRLMNVAEKKLFNKYNR